MPIDAAYSSGFQGYVFFAGGRHVHLTRGDTGHGTVLPGYPKSNIQLGLPSDFGRSGIDATLRTSVRTYYFAGSSYLDDIDGTNPSPADRIHSIDRLGWPDGFGKYGIDAALNWGSNYYFFAGTKFIRVSPGNFPGTVSLVWPRSISEWGWPDGFGKYGIDAAVDARSKAYFFDGNFYVRVTRSDNGTITVDPGYPKAISDWGWPDDFGSHRDGIDAALYSGSKCYFFAGDRYIRVTRGDTGAGTVDPGYPKNITGWPSFFGKYGIDAALYSGSKYYLFAGDSYIRVTRGPNTVDPGYPAPISAWGWPSFFGKYGIDAALYSGSKCYFFAGDSYIRVTRGDTGAGTVDPGYPKNITEWGWKRELTILHFKTLLPLSVVSTFVSTQFAAIRDLFTTVGVEVRRGSTEDLSMDTRLSHLVALDVGECRGRLTAEQRELFAKRDGAQSTDIVAYVVQTLVGPSGFPRGCATSPLDEQPGLVIVPVGSGEDWLLAHEVGHILGLAHVDGSDNLMFEFTSWTKRPPYIGVSQVWQMAKSSLTIPQPF